MKRFDSVAKRSPPTLKIRLRREADSVVLIQVNVCGADDVDLAVVAAEEERSVGLYAPESPGHDRAIAGMNAEARSVRMRAREPCLGQERRLARAPLRQQPREASCKQRCKGLGSDDPSEVRSLPVSQSRRSREVHAEADYDPVTAALEQDSSDFPTHQHRVVWPFEHERLRRHCGVDGLNERESGRERQALRGRVAGPQLDQGAAEKVARCGDPFAALPPPAGVLVERDEPVALVQRLIGNDVGVGRTGPLDNPDTAQNKDPAARSLIAPSGPMRR